MMFSMLARMFVLGLLLLQTQTTPILAGPASDEQETATETFSVSGQLQGLDGQPRNVHSAAVFVVDAGSGYPLLAESQMPIGRENGLAGPDGWLHVLTNELGEFSITGLRPGSYRLVSQSWIGRSTVPTQQDADAVIMLHGRSGTIDLAETDIEDIPIVALGDAVLKLNCVPDEGNAYLFVGTAAPAAEPIMGPLFWGDDFIHSVSGVTHIRRGTQIVQGLPQGQRVHVMLLNYDNNAGVGGVSVPMQPMTQAALPIYATWSNGYHQPPPHLEALVEWVRDHQIAAAGMLTSGDAAGNARSRSRAEYHEMVEYLHAHGHEKRSIAQLGEFSLLDVAAAQSYLRILQIHESRRGAAQEADARDTPPPDAKDDLP